MGRLFWVPLGACLCLLGCLNEAPLGAANKESSSSSYLSSVDESSEDDTIVTSSSSESSSNDEQLSNKESSSSGSTGSSDEQESSSENSSSSSSDTNLSSESSSSITESSSSQKVETDERDREGWSLVWADEFEKDGLPDDANWKFDYIESPNNGELQIYAGKRIENSRVENGSLIIEARKEQYEGKEYTSARLLTHEKQDWLYGRFEIRAKMPTGKGVWPAFWMMPSDAFINATTCSNETGWSAGCDAWPGCGEIDIVEYVTFQPDVAHSALHNKNYNFMLGNNPVVDIEIEHAETEFHTYALEWYEDRLEYFIDDQFIMDFKNDNTGWQSWPFDTPFYLILNVAVGGDWGGALGIDDTIDSWKFTIDYVRVYQVEE
ncbi:MAG: glycoside hydrolase family 16 protein [Reichenbachiella sp.]